MISVCWWLDMECSLAGAGRAGAQMIDKTCLIGGAKAVVDIDDRDAAGAGVEHGEQRGHATKVRAVAHAGGNGDDRATHQAADDACQGAFHAGDGDDHLRLGKFLSMSEQAVQAGDTYVVEAIDFVAVELGRQCRLFGDGQVARTGAGDDDASVAGGGGLAAHEGELCVRDISQVDAVAEKFRGTGGLFGVQARDQDALLACIAQRFDNGGNLPGGFTGAVDNLAGSLAYPA